MTVQTPATGCYTGLYSYPNPASTFAQSQAQWATRETDSGRGHPYDIGHYFRNFTQGLSNIQAGTQLDWHVAQGRIPMVSWNANGPGGEQASCQAIAAGSYDGNGTTDGIRKIARTLKTRGRVLFRWYWEMDAEGPESTSTFAADYIAAWRHIHNIFHSSTGEGAFNVEMVWCPNAWDWDGTSKGTPHADFYPGDAYVDWIAADGYNWNNNDTFEDIFEDWYAWASTEHANIPLLIGETGCNEHADATFKNTWFTAMWAKLQVWTQIKALVAFDTDYTVSNPSHYDWRLDTDAGSYSAWNTGAATTFFNTKASSDTGTTPIPGGGSETGGTDTGSGAGAGSVPAGTPPAPEALPSAPAENTAVIPPAIPGLVVSLLEYGDVLLQKEIDRRLQLLERRPVTVPVRAANTAPVEGEIWAQGDSIYVHSGGVTRRYTGTAV